MAAGTGIYRWDPPELGMTIDDATDRIVDIKGDKANPMTNGYVCFKGLQAEEAHHLRIGAHRGVRVEILVAESAQAQAVCFKRGHQHAPMIAGIMRA